MDLPTETGNFAYRLDWYKTLSRVPTEWFERPDSVEVIAEDVSDFEHLVKNPEKEKIVQEQTEDERFLVAAKVAGTLRIERLGSVEWIEIEEPSEMEQITGMTGVKNVNFYYNDFEKARAILGIRGILYELFDFDDHYQLRVIFDREGNSFGLNNRPMTSLVDERIKKQKAKLLNPNQKAA